MPIANFDRDLGLRPVRPDAPAGDNPRNGEAFTALKTQIDQLTDIHGNASVDWAAVAGLGAQILGQEGKDLAAATWLTAALLETGGPAGLADGIHILRNLAETYWADMSPPATRLRGRRNQMQWMLDFLGERIQARRDDYSPLPVAVHASMLEDWTALDTEWQRHDTESPAFYGLSSMLRSLPMEAPAQAAQESAAATAAQAVAPASASPSTQAAAAPPAAPRPASLAAVPAAGTDPEAAADAALAGLRPLLDWYLETQPTLPLLFRMNRVCAWLTLEQSPPAQGGLTRLAPPPLQTVDGFQLIAQTGEPQAVVQFAESHLIVHRYWLDLNRASHAALTHLGAADAAAAVAFETARLIARLPELPGLKFSDGQPFADPQTRAWLEGLAGAQPGVSEDGADGGELAGLAGASETDAAAGRLSDALERLQAATRRADGQRARFRLRLAQCELLHRYDDRADIRPLMAPLIEELDAHRLPLWEPDLARQVLALAAAVELRYGANDAGPAHPLLARLASVDCRAAWQLSQSTAAA